jgi:hypothetical protein
MPQAKNLASLLKWRVSPFGLLVVVLLLDYLLLARLSREVRSTVQSGGFAVDTLCRFLVSPGVVEVALTCLLASGLFARFLLRKPSEARIWSVFILTCCFTVGFAFWVVHSIIHALPLVNRIVP